jgi:hypothetical protein
MPDNSSPVQYTTKIEITRTAPNISLKITPLNGDYFYTIDMNNIVSTIVDPTFCSYLISDLVLNKCNKSDSTISPITTITGTTNFDILILLLVKIIDGTASTL